MPKVKKSKVLTRVPYAKGFKPAGETKQRNALGLKNDIPPEFSAKSDPSGFQFFQQVPQPNSINDWLAMYNEDGQTYKQFLTECPWLSERKRKSVKQKFVPKGANIREKYPDGKIYLVPVGDFNEEQFYFDELVKFAQTYLGIPVHSLPNIKTEVKIKDKKIFWMENPKSKSSYRVTENRKSSRSKIHTLESRFHGDQYQLCVVDLLKMLRMKIPDDAICLIGLTMSDLYGDLTDLFVAGMAAGNHRVAIFSFYRYDPTLTFCEADWFKVHRDISQNSTNGNKIMFERSCKLLVHEINHLLGIDHCIFYECCMNGSGHLEEDFRQPMHLCPIDLHKLQTLVGFDIISRYKKLLDFYEKHEMNNEKEWVQRRIKMLEIAKK